MTPDALRELVTAIDPSLPGVEEPTALLRALEDRADRKPTERTLARAVHAAHGMATASDGLPRSVAGVRRRTLVRWDGWTVTWDGPHLESGRTARVRTLRPHAARDPVLRRALAREAQALQATLGDLPVIAVEGSQPAIRAPLPGAPLSPSADPDDLRHPEVLARLLATALTDLERWERHRLGLPRPGARELLDTPAGLRVVCLTPVATGEAGERIAALARLLSRWWGDGPESAVAPVLAGLEAFPPRTAHEAAAQVRAALAEDLADRRHTLRRRATRIRRADQAARLLGLIRRLEAAVPPPEGRGAVGVDLEGRTTAVVSRRGRIQWGPPEQPTTVRTRNGDLDVRPARRLLRVRASSPPNPRLQSDVDGSLEEADRIGRWLAGAVELRTLRKLLEAELEVSRPR